MRQFEQRMTIGRARKDHDPFGTFVYFIRAGDKGPIKIGIACNPYERLAMLQTGNPYKLCLLAAVVGVRSDEVRLHKEYALEALEGEWFRPSKRLLAFITEHGEPPTEDQVLQTSTAKWRQAKRQNCELTRVVAAARSEHHNKKPLLCRLERWETQYGPPLANRSEEEFGLAREAVMAVLPPCRPVCKCSIQ